MNSKIDRNLSHSQIKSFLECKRQWAYKFRDGYKTKDQNPAFLRGRLLHYGMEAGIEQITSRKVTGSFAENGWLTAVAKFEKEHAQYNLMVPPGWYEGCCEIVTGALAGLFSEWEVVEDAKGPMIERRLYINLPEYYKGIVCIPDLVVRRKIEPYYNCVFGLDYKSFGKPKLPIYSDVDLQSVLYQKALLQYGHRSLGSVIFQLATEPRKPIRYKKDGEPYAGDQERFDNWSPINPPLLSVRNEETVEGIWEQAVVPVIQEMFLTEVAGNPEQPPHLDYYGCQYCDFFAPCQARLKGQDEDAILADNYIRRGERQKGA